MIVAGEERWIREEVFCNRKSEENYFISTIVLWRGSPIYRNPKAQPE